MTTIKNAYRPVHLPSALPTTSPSAPPTQCFNRGQDPYDRRTAEKILKNPLFSSLDKGANPAGARFLNLDKFYEKVGGNWNDKRLSPRQRADIAANAERVLEHIDRMGGRHSTGYNNNIDGLMPDRITLEARYINNTVNKDSEYMRLLDFCERGYTALSGSIVTPR
ncbi:hypothetical protein [Pseudomonas poae]|uniref:hypothetical protein n=1 Tax=Pseudomonas poae TaxID=200451 RepID=UPI0011CE306C|nr:hypothetical protein [Pseudomonas poae]